MSKTNVVEVSGRETIADPLTDLLRVGAERLIYRAVEAELEELLAAHSEDVWRMVERVWCEMATCQRERYRRDWDR